MGNYFDGRNMHRYLDGLSILMEEVCTDTMMGYFDGRSMHRCIDGIIILMVEVCTYILMG